MSFEGPKTSESSPDFEREGIEEKTLESLPGFLPELLRITFGEQEQGVFEIEILDGQGISLDDLTHVSDETAKDVIKLFSQYQEEKKEGLLDDQTVRGLRAAQIADVIRGK
jgi:hypothetical protein